MSIDALEAARCICKKSDWSISNLKLQKILYMAHLAYMGEHNGQPLIDGRFEAWDFGPVQPQVYKYGSLFGSSPIKRMASHKKMNEHPQETLALDRFTESLLKYSPSELVAMTHWNEGAWAKHYKPGRQGIVIPNADILEEYRARVRHISRQI